MRRSAHARPASADALDTVSRARTWVNTRRLARHDRAMRLLVLGGTVFLGRAGARHALAAGHDVTCAARGASGDPVDGVRFVQGDRADPDALSALDGEFDAGVDVAR